MANTLSPENRYLGTNPFGYDSSQYHPTTESGNQLLKWQLEHPGIRAPIGSDTGHLGPDNNWGGQGNPYPVMPVNAGGNPSTFDGIPSGANPNPVMPPTALNPIQSNAFKFADPEASFTPFQAQAQSLNFPQQLASPFGSQQMPSFNMQSFKYPPMNPTSGGGKNWWEMQW